MDWDEMFPNRFLKAGLFKGRDVTLVISKVVLELMEDDKGKKDRGIIHFEGTPRQLVINKTNGICLKAMFGRDTEKWIGKRVTLFPTDVRFGKTVDLGIRVRGSPDIPRDMEVEIKLAKKKPQTMTLHRTQVNSKGGQRPASAQQTKTAPVAAPRTESGRVDEFAPPDMPEPPLPDEPPADVMLPGQDGYDVQTGEIPFS